jgi:hypothetical protein
VELTGVAQKGATVHDLTNRKHQDDAEAMETTTMPFSRLGKTTDAVAAMAGGENLAGDQENGPRSHQTRKR